MTRPWEIGSEFHWNTDYLRRAGPPDHWPEKAGFFARAGGALMALMTRWTSVGQRPRLHLPSYYCMDVAERLASVCDILWFDDLPTRSSPRFASLTPESGDFVLALNHFGQWTSDRWSGFIKPPGVMLIEDHSHDPYSAWARSSGADYAVASLRKTLPIPDGAWLWSPAGHVVPELVGPEPAGAVLKLAAMLLKAGYLDNAAVDKDSFRALQIEGERGLDDPHFAPASRFTTAMLPFIDGPALRARRIANNARLQDRLAGRAGEGFALLRPAGADEVTSFSPVLVCEDRAVRDALRAHLQHHAVFAPNHWPQDAAGYNSGDADAIRLAGRLLTVPIDFRYGAADVDAVADILSSFEPAVRSVPQG